MNWNIKLKFYKYLHSDAARFEIRNFLEKHSTTEMILDVGGRNSPYKDLFPRRTCIDTVPGDDVDVIGSVYTLPFPDNSFSKVLCTEVYEHLEYPNKASEEIKRVLKPGGKLIITTRFLYPIHGEPYDYFRYTQYGLMSVLKTFETVEIHPELGGWRSLSSLIQGYVWEEKSKMGKIKLFTLLISAKLLQSLPKLPTNVGHRMASGYHVICTKKST